MNLFENFRLLLQKKGQKAISKLINFQLTNVDFVTCG